MARRSDRASVGPAPEDWPDFLRGTFVDVLRRNFNADPRLIALTFSVSHETARLWLDGRSLPRLETFLAQVYQDPGFAAAFGIVIDFPGRGDAGTEARPDKARRVA